MVTKHSHKNNWLEKLVAILALINFVLVLFDYSYVPWRDFYLRTFPVLTQVYDKVKKIEPHPLTENYIEKFNTLKDKVSASSRDLPETELQELRTLSRQLLDDNPFEAIAKSGTLEKIKHELSKRTQQNSASEAFATFWSPDYLDEVARQQEIDYFDREIIPLIATNYYRDLGRFGKFIDYFWLIDLPFTVVFALDILIRAYNTKRRVPHLNWWEALLRRWYDFFLLLPFWRWLRILPVTVHLYRADLLNLKPLRKQLNYSFIIGFIEEIAEILGVHVINRMQKSVKNGEVMHWLLHPERRSYTQVNNRNEIEAITTRLVSISVRDVLPQIQPDLEALLHHTITTTFERSPVYRRLQKLPGFNEFPERAIEQLAINLSQRLYDNVVKGVKDPIATQLSERMLTHFRTGLEVELQKKDNMQYIESLLVDMLEEIKINYVEKIAQNGFDEIAEEANRIHKSIAQDRSIQ